MKIIQVDATIFVQVPNDYPHENCGLNIRDKVSLYRFVPMPNESKDCVIEDFEVDSYTTLNVEDVTNGET